MAFSQRRLPAFALSNAFSPMATFRNPPSPPICQAAAKIALSCNP